VHYKYYKKHSRSGLAWSRPRADRGLIGYSKENLKIHTGFPSLPPLPSPFLLPLPCLPLPLPLPLPSYIPLSLEVGPLKSS